MIRDESSDLRLELTERRLGIEDDGGDFITFTFFGGSVRGVVYVGCFS